MNSTKLTRVLLSLGAYQTSSIAVGTQIFRVLTMRNSRNWRNLQCNSKRAIGVFRIAAILLQACVVAGENGGAPAWRLPLGHGHSVLGDPGMRSEKVRVAVEGWNFCNRVGYESPDAPSPRWADCTDIVCGQSDAASDGERRCKAVHKVSELDNGLQTGEIFPRGSFEISNDADLYVVEKEKYLASLCEVGDSSDNNDNNNKKQPWAFWMIMLKNGNYDQSSGLCRDFSKSTTRKPFFLNPRTGPQLNAFPCFGAGCMNQPVVFQNLSTVQGDSLSGSVYGTYDVDQAGSLPNSNISYFEVKWEKHPKSGSWIFSHKLTVSPKYPWLMLYLRADATRGISGGYPWETRGMMHQIPVSPNFKVVLTLNVLQGGGPASQFYLIDIGGCWKNSGEACDGDMDSDVTRYVEMIINPETPSWCRSNNLALCPPYHTAIDGTQIHRTNTTHFPYEAYHLYCSPPNALHPENPVSVCDPFSNPQSQELVQLLPHPEWAVHGYPEKKGDGWVGDPRTWNLDVGALSSRLYFYQDPDTPPAVRVWPSVDVGTEVYVSSRPYVAEWTVSDFNVLITSSEETSTVM